MNKSKAAVSDHPKYRWPVFIMLCIVSLSLVLIPACRKKQQVEEIILPPITSLALGTEWGVVVDTNYLRLREKPNKQAPSTQGLTLGMVVEIISTTGEQETIEDLTAPWYNVNATGMRGWVFGGYLQLFNSRKAAEAYAGELQ